MKTKKHLSVLIEKGSSRQTKHVGPLLPDVYAGVGDVSTRARSVSVILSRSQNIRTT